MIFGAGELAVEDGAPAGDRTTIASGVGRAGCRPRPDPVTLDPIAAVERREVSIAATADADYKAAPDATTVLQLERPDGRREQITPTLADSDSAFTARVPAGDAGITEHADVSRGTPIGTAVPFLRRSSRAGGSAARREGALLLAGSSADPSADHAADAGRFLRSSDVSARRMDGNLHSPWIRAYRCRARPRRTPRRQWPEAEGAAGCCVAFLASASLAVAEERYALIVSALPGGAACNDIPEVEQQLTAALRDRLGFSPDRIEVLSGMSADGDRRARGRTSSRRSRTSERRARRRPGAGRVDRAWDGRRRQREIQSAGARHDVADCRAPS
jgi:hypothetical protein